MQFFVVLLAVCCLLAGRGQFPRLSELDQGTHRLELALSLNITIGSANITASQFLLVNDTDLSNAVGRDLLSSLGHRLMARSFSQSAKHLVATRQLWFRSVSTAVPFQIARADGTVANLQRCTDTNDACLCSISTATAVTACEQCFFATLIQEHRLMPNPLAGNSVTLTSQHIPLTPR